MPAATPLVRIDTFNRLTIYAKLENLEPSGSVKYRTVSRMLDDAISSGELKAGMRLVEVTSGNTGIALALRGKELDHKVTIVASQLATEETKRMIEGYGAEIIESDSYAKGVKLVEKMMREELGRWYWTRQTSNPSSLKATIALGKEILGQFKNQFGGTIDYYVGSIATGSTLSGVGKAFKDANPQAIVYRVAPKAEFKYPGVEDVDETSMSLIPIFDNAVVDEVIKVDENDAIDAARELNTRYNHNVGVSSGADFFAAKELAERHEGNCVIIFPDSGDRYHIL